MTIEQFNSLLNGKEIYDVFDGIVFGENYIIRPEQFRPTDDDGKPTNRKIEINSTADTIDCYINNVRAYSGPFSGIAYLMYKLPTTKMDNKMYNEAVYNNYILS